MTSGAEAVLYDIDGDPMAVENGAAIPVLTSVLIGGGSDGTNARFIKVDSSGNQIITGLGTAGSPTGGVVTIQGVGGGTAVPISGTVTANAGSGNFSVVQAVAANLNATVIGTVTANIGTSGSLALDATLAKLTISPSTAIGSNTLAMVGGHVTTASPTYTNGNINPLSLTTAGALRIDGSSVTQPVSDAGGSLTIDNSTLAVVGGGTEATALRVTIANNSTGVLSVDDNGASLTIDTTQLPAALVGGRLDANIGAWLGSTAPTVGSKTSANSIPVVVASDQGTITVNASATVGIVDNAAFTDGTTRIQPVGFIFDEVAGTALTENDGAAARIDSKRAQIQVIEDGTTRGTRATVKAASTAAVAADTALVVAVSPNNTVNTKELRSPTATASSVAASASSVSLLASNANRLGATIYNDSNQPLYVQLGATASTTSFIVKMNKDDYYELPFNYTGVINGIWSSASGSARIVELT